jgi:hypothetical protein
MTAGPDRAVDLSRARARLGRIGVWLSALGPLPAHAEREAVQRIEALGYPSLWITETQKEAFAHGARLPGALPDVAQQYEQPSRAWVFGG